MKSRNNFLQPSDAHLTYQQKILLYVSKILHFMTSVLTNNSDILFLVILNLSVTISQYTSTQMFIFSTVKRAHSFRATKECSS